jgi:uncharacterized glyoxalase superfamily protein PhnB
MGRINEVFPYLRVKGAAEAIEFYRRVFGAEEIFRLNEPGTGRVGHAEIKIGDTIIMLADEFPEMGFVGPVTLGGTTFSIHLHVDNADAYIEQARQAGATVLREAADHFYGERSGTVRDPFGHEWMLGHHIEDVSPEEMQHRYDAVMAKR